MSNGKLKYFKTATIQEKKRGFVRDKLGKHIPIVRDNFDLFWITLPKKIVRASGFKPSKIAEELGMKYDWVISHISDKFKDKPMQAIAGFRPTIKESDTDFSPAIELNQPESTMTEEEKPNLEMVKITS